MQFLDFEQPIAELLAMIDELKGIEHEHQAIAVQKEVQALEGKVVKLTSKIFSKLTDWNKVQLARHPQRPLASDYLKNVFSHFVPLHGDRMFADDKALLAGLARLRGQPVMVLAQEKGRNAQEKRYHNFGMMHPEGYRKAHRLALLAQKFGLPVISLIDTPGAYPGVQAEERGQSEAIAANLKLFSQLKVPTLSLVIGEGCSGGALGIGVTDRILTLQYSYYATISPEGCASILYKSASKAQVATESMKITSEHLLEQKIVDGVIQEPLGGAHRDKDAHYQAVEHRLFEELDMLARIPNETRLKQRFKKIREYGRFTKIT